MLTLESYLLALGVQLLATIGGVWLLYKLWFAIWRRTTACVITGLTVGLLLAPSYPMEDVSTLAPALITGVFNLLFSGGFTAAKSALISLSVCGFVGAAIGRFYAAIVSKPSAS